MSTNTSVFWSNWTKLVKVVDTHTHADHITAMGALRDRTKCVTVMGDQSAADVVSMRVSEGEKIDIEGLSLDVLYTPTHGRSIRSGCRTAS